MPTPRGGFEPRHAARGAIEISAIEISSPAV
jgi:hypothetical protein